MNYPKELVRELQECIKENFNLELSDEKAIEYLDSYADLFLAFID
jgi:hypothetical protein